MTIFQIIFLYLIIGIIITLIFNIDHSLQNEIKKRHLKPDTIIVLLIVGWIYIIPKALIIYIRKVKK